MKCYLCVGFKWNQYTFARLSLRDSASAAPVMQVNSPSGLHYKGVKRYFCVNMLARYTPVLPVENYGKAMAFCRREHGVFYFVIHVEWFCVRTRAPPTSECWNGLCCLWSYVSTVRRNLLIFTTVQVDSAYLLTDSATVCTTRRGIYTQRRVLHVDTSGSTLVLSNWTDAPEHRISRWWEKLLSLNPDP